jgi:hypothetical protein
MAVPLLALGLPSLALAQTGAYTLNGGTANLPSITTNGSVFFRLVHP